MLVPLIIRAINEASPALKSVQDSLNGVSNSAKTAASDALGLNNAFNLSPVQQKLKEVASLESEVAIKTNELKNSANAQSLAAQKGNIATLERIVAEKQVQSASDQSEKSIQALAKAEDNLARARARLSLTEQKQDLSTKREALNLAQKELGVLQNTRGVATGLNGILGGATQQLAGGLSNANVAATGLIDSMGGILAGIFAASKAMDYFSSQFNAASKAQLSLIGQSSEIQRIYGVDEKTGDKFYRSTKTKIEIAGRDTSVSSNEISEKANVALPLILRSFRTSNRSLEDAQNATVDLSTRFAIAAQTTQGVTPFQVQGALTSALSGKLSDALNNQEFFRNSGLGTIINDIARQKGIDIASATATQQIDLLEQGLQLKVPDSLIQRAQKTAESQISAFTDTLFAEQTGLFSFQRNLQKDVQGQEIPDTSVASSLFQTVNLIIGKDGIIAEIVGILKGTSVETDPMVELKNVIDSINNDLKGLLTFFQTIHKNLANIQNNELFKLFNQATSILPNPGETVVKTDEKGNFSSDYGGRLVDQAKQSVQGFDIGKFIFGNPIQGKYEGITAKEFNRMIPAYSGFMSAISAEILNKPTGSNLVVANSSEAVLTPEQLSAIVESKSQNINGSTNTKNTTVNIGDIVINALPGMSPDTIAQSVIDAIDAKFNYSQSVNLLN